MVKLKAGKGKKRGRKPAKKPKQIEEITLSSDEEQDEVMASSEDENSDEEKMDVDENGQDIDNFSDDDNPESETDKNGQESESLVNENGDGTVSNETMEENKMENLDENGDDSTSKEKLKGEEYFWFFTYWIFEEKMSMTPFISVKFLLKKWKNQVYAVVLSFLRVRVATNMACAMPFFKGKLKDHLQKSLVKNIRFRL